MRWPSWDFETTQKNSVSLINWKEETGIWISKMKANLKANDKNSQRWEFWIRLTGCPYKAKHLITQILPRNFVFMFRNIKPMDWSPQWISESSKVRSGKLAFSVKNRQSGLFLKEGGWMSVTLPILMLSSFALWWAIAHIGSLVIWDWKKQGTLLGASRMRFMAKYSCFGESQLSVTVPG